MEIKNEEDLDLAIEILTGIIREKLNRGQIVNYEIVMPKINRDTDHPFMEEPIPGEITGFEPGTITFDI